MFTIKMKYMYVHMSVINFPNIVLVSYINI